MSYYVIIRGPLGIGKSTVSVRIAKALGAKYVSVDRILEEPGVEEWDAAAGHYSERAFLRTSELAAERARVILDQGKPVIFDGNFYWQSQITDLVGRLPFPHHVFTLQAPLDLCIQRDGKRVLPHGREAAEKVYAKSTEFEWGVGIDATPSVERVVSNILAQIRVT
jgi:tRNA uridine 5-carbamoylmethylation protein Kti12